MTRLARALLSALLLALCGCAGEPLAARGSCRRGTEGHPRAATYRSALESHCRGARAPGCVLLVARDREEVWAGATGFADLDAASPMCVDTPFRIASISKVYLAALVLGLVERQRLSLGDRLGDRLPDVARQIPGADAITVEHLLSHRSGLSSPATDDISLQLDLFDRADELARMDPAERLRRYVYGRPLRFAPGTAYRYSNTGFELLGLIAERVEATPLEVLLARHLTEPAGLAHTSLADADHPRVARGYATTGEGLLLDVTAADLANLGPRSASGGIVTTAEDLLAFFDALLGARLLQASTVAAMHSPRCDDPGGCTRGYGLGLAWNRTAEPFAIGHAGALVGVVSYAFRFPDAGVTVVLLRNLKRSSAADMDFVRSLAR